MEEKLIPELIPGYKCPKCGYFGEDEEVMTQHLNIPESGLELLVGEVFGWRRDGRRATPMEKFAVILGKAGFDEEHRRGYNFRLYELEPKENIFEQTFRWFLRPSPYMLHRDLFVLNNEEYQKAINFLRFYSSSGFATGDPSYMGTLKEAHPDIVLTKGTKTKRKSEPAQA